MNDEGRNQSYQNEDRKHQAQKDDHHRQRLAHPRAVQVAVVQPQQCCNSRCQAQRDFRIGCYKDTQQQKPSRTNKGMWCRRQCTDTGNGAEEPRRWKNE